MKTKTTVSVMGVIFIGLIIMSGCATTGPKPTSPTFFTEPVNSESTLLIGRITLTCENFPNNWHVNGEHKRGIVMDLKNVNTNEIITIKSKGSDGLFYLLDTPGNYEIVKFEYGIKSGRYWSTLTITAQYFIKIEKGIVNNLGDIHCTWTYVETAKRGRAKVQFNENYDEVKEWFQMTYPDSNWNNQNWLDETAVRVPIAGVASGTPEELKQFPVVFNGEHIMNIYLQYIGKTPEDKYSYGAKSLPPERRDEVDFYHRELENITEYTMEIFESKTNHETYNRNELIEMWGIGFITLNPHERQISKDNWVTGQVGFKWVITYKIRILDTNEMFAIRTIYTRVP